jgi:hypothetical protein
MCFRAASRHVLSHIILNPHIQRFCSRPYNCKCSQKQKTRYLGRIKAHVCALECIRVLQSYGISPAGTCVEAPAACCGYSPPQGNHKATCFGSHQDAHSMRLAPPAVEVFEYREVHTHLKQLGFWPIELRLLSRDDIHGYIFARKSAVSGGLVLPRPGGTQHIQQ